MPVVGNKQIQSPPINSTFLVFTLFITGAGILVIEILGSRLLSPFFGVGLFVWSALITVALSALSIGYWWGGRLADKKPDPSRLYFLILLAGILTILIPFFAPPLLNSMLHIEIRVATLVSGTLLFGPSLLVLGMVAPYAVKLYTNEVNSIGRRVGRLYAISTLGSCFGSVVTGFLLVPYLGVSRIFYLVGAVFVFLWTLHALISKKRTIVTIIPFLLACGVSFIGPARSEIPSNMKTIYETDSIYGHLEVREKGEKRWLMIDGAPNSGINKVNTFPLTPYTYNFELMTHMNPQAKSLFLVGLGGGSIANRFQDHGLLVDSAELDPSVAQIAQDYFFFKPKSGRVFIQDARRVIRTADRKYDFLILDVFNGDLAPLHLFSTEAFQEMSLIMNPKGIVGINYIGYVEGFHSRVTRSIYRTLKDVFPYVNIYPRIEGEKLVNIIFLASHDPLEIKKPIEEHAVPEVRALLKKMTDLQLQKWGNDFPLESTANSLILTDEFNPIQVWNLKPAMEWRKTIWTRYGIES